MISHKAIRSIPLYHLRTADYSETLDVNQLVVLKMTPAPILWEYHGSFYLVPMGHVADIFDAISHHNASTKKSAWDRPTISLADATPIGYELGRMLSRRVNEKKLQTRDNDGDIGNE